MFLFIHGLTWSVFFLIEKSSNFAQQIFTVAQYFVSFVELIFAIYGHLILRKFVPRKLLHAKISALNYIWWNTVIHRSFFKKYVPSYFTYCSRCVFYTVIFEASFGLIFTKNSFNFSAIVFSWIISFSFNYLTVLDKTISNKSDKIFRRWRKFFPTK